MPSWNIHTAHVERLLADRRPEELGVADTNAFLFGNYVPDIYVGFMVPDATYRIDYCVTHLARPNTIPIPDADFFWDLYICRPVHSEETSVSLALGAWAHLVADQYYNGRFRMFRQTHDTPSGKELRIRKQSDFALFGNSLNISSHVQATPELYEAARTFWGYTVLAEDVDRSIQVADDIVRTNGGAAGADAGAGATGVAGVDADTGAGIGAAGGADAGAGVADESAGAAGAAGAYADAAAGRYQLLDAAWMSATFEACNERLITWLEAWQDMGGTNRITAADVRLAAGLPSVESDTLGGCERFFTGAAGETFQEESR